jgi:succinylarginine dihydrolase
VDPRFLVDEAKLDVFAKVVAQYWPEHIDPALLNEPDLWQALETAHIALLKAANLEVLIPSCQHTPQDQII